MGGGANLAGYLFGIAGWRLGGFGPPPPGLLKASVGGAFD